MVKKGEKIIFTKLKYQHPNMFTLGKKYFILEISEIIANNKILVKVIDDEGTSRWVNLDYFNDINLLREWKLNRIIDND